MSYNSACPTVNLSLKWMLALKIIYFFSTGLITLIVDKKIVVITENKLHPVL